MTNEESTKIAFMTPRAEVLVLRHGQICHIEKMRYIFFKNLLLKHRSEKLSVKLRLQRKGQPKILNFVIPGAGVLVLGHGNIVKMQYFFPFSCIQWGMD